MVVIPGSSRYVCVCVCVKCSVEIHQQKHNKNLLKDKHFRYLEDPGTWMSQEVAKWLVNGFVTSIYPSVRRL